MRGSFRYPAPGHAGPYSAILHLYIASRGGGRLTLRLPLWLVHLGYLFLSLLLVYTGWLAVEARSAELNMRNLVTAQRTAVRLQRSLAVSQVNNDVLAGTVRDGTHLLADVRRQMSPYTVRPGDTLYTIAATNHITMGEILVLNPSVHFGHLIVPGTRIFLPSGGHAVVNLMTDGNAGALLVAFAKRYLGYPYHLVGGDPVDGFSCVAFTYWIYTALGVRIPGDLSAQYAVFPKVKRGRLEPGDLVFFRDTVWQGLSHVGIYIGHGEFIHDQDFRTGVVITSMRDPYYATRYFGAVDPLGKLGFSR